MLDFERVLNTGIDPKDLLLSLEIETCYRSAPSLYCEVFRMPDGRGMLYWRNSLQFDNRIIEFINNFSDVYNITKDKGIEEIFANPHFVKEYQKINPVKIACISTEKMRVVYKIVNEGLPKDVQFPHGLDGHEYYLTTYGKTKQKYQAWIAIPKEWGRFAEFVEMLIDAGNWNRCYKCQYNHCVYYCGKNETTTEKPPWMKA